MQEEKLPNNEDELAKVSGGISVREAGARGGRSTLQRRGTKFFREIGRRGGRRTAELYHDLLKEFGKKGGRPRRPALHESAGDGDR